MNKFSLTHIGLLLFFMLHISSCENKRKSIRTNNLRCAIEFQDTIHHFGVIHRENPIDSFDFKFKNTGARPVVILGAYTSCKCTAVKYEFEPVMPGATSYIRIVYDGTGREPEYFNKSATIHTSALDEPFKLSFDGILQ